MVSFNEIKTDSRHYLEVFVNGIKVGIISGSSFVVNSEGKIAVLQYEDLKSILDKVHEVSVYGIQKCDKCGGSPKHPNLVKVANFFGIVDRVYCSKDVHFPPKPPKV